MRMVLEDRISSRLGLPDLGKLLEDCGAIRSGDDYSRGYYNGAERMYIEVKKSGNQ